MPVYTDEASLLEDMLYKMHNKEVSINVVLLLFVGSRGYGLVGRLLFCFLELNYKASNEEIPLLAWHCSVKWMTIRGKKETFKHVRGIIMSLASTSFVWLSAND